MSHARYDNFVQAAVKELTTFSGNVEHAQVYATLALAEATALTAKDEK